MNAVVSVANPQCEAIRWRRAVLQVVLRKYSIRDELTPSRDRRRAVA